jgi:CheY-like chemotaxis protein
VYLPASAKAVASEVTAIVKHAGNGAIIIMDDEEIIRTTVGDMLESLGYSVACKNDGKEAIDFYRVETGAGCRFAAMIFDLTIPGGMGGIEAVAEVRKVNKEIPVFVASGYADNSAMKDPARYGFTASICKPFTIAELSEMLDRYLRV